MHARQATHLALALALAIGLLLAWQADWAQDWGRLLREGHDGLLAALHHAPLSTTAQFFALFVLVSALPVPGASLLCLAAGACYGLVWGTLLACAACTTGATLTMLAARHLVRSPLRGALQHRLGQGLAQRLQALDEGFSRDGAFYLFSLRVLPVVPYFIVNPLAGLTRMPTWTFIWVSYLGMLAGTAVYVNAGVQLATVHDRASLLSPAVLGALALLALLPWLARWGLGALRRARA